MVPFYGLAESGLSKTSLHQLSLRVESGFCILKQMLDAMDGVDGEVSTGGCELLFKLLIWLFSRFCVLAVSRKPFLGINWWRGQFLPPRPLESESGGEFREEMRVKNHRWTNGRN